MSVITHNLLRYQTRIARVMLVLFVMAWTNLVFQAPLHAAMKMNNDLPCHCMDTLCETVLGMQDQADDGLTGVVPILADAPVAFQLLPVMVPAVHLGQQYQLAQLTFHQTSLSPLALTGVLRI